MIPVRDHRGSVVDGGEMRERSGPQTERRRRCGEREGETRNLVVSKPPRIKVVCSIDQK